jgi:hypothetical protein
MDFFEEREKKGQNQKSDPRVQKIRGVNAVGPGSDRLVGNTPFPNQQQQGSATGPNQTARSTGGIAQQVAALRGQMPSPQAFEGGAALPPPPQSPGPPAPGTKPSAAPASGGKKSFEERYWDAQRRFSENILGS